MQMLGDLSNEELLARLRAHIGTGHAWQARLIEYLAEVERRRLDVEYACSSIWDFCVRKLGMSDGEAHRRIAAARVIREFPRALAYLERGDIHLCGLYVLRKHLTADNHEELLREASGMSTRQIEEIVAARFPKPDVPDRLEPVGMQAPLRMAATGAVATSVAPAALHPTERRARVEPLSSTRYRVELTISSELKAKLERVRDLMLHRNPTGELEPIFDVALGLLLTKLEKERLGKTSRPRKVKHAKTHAPVADLDTQDRPVASGRDALGRDAANSTTEIGTASAVATTPTLMTPEDETASAVATTVALTSPDDEGASAVATTTLLTSMDDERASAVATTMAVTLPDDETTSAVATTTLLTSMGDERASAVAMTMAVTLPDDERASAVATKTLLTSMDDETASAVATKTLLTSMDDETASAVATTALLTSMDDETASTVATTTLPTSTDDERASAVATTTLLTSRDDDGAAAPAVAMTMPMTTTDGEATAAATTMRMTMTGETDCSAPIGAEPESLLQEAGLGVIAEIGDVTTAARDAETNQNTLAAAAPATGANAVADRNGQSKRGRAGGVSRPTRREVFARDSERCTYIDAEGSRCPSRGFLELDHVDVRARGGSNDPANLRVRCRRHNRLYAEQVFGREYVAQKIESRRRKHGAAARSVGPETPSNAQRVAGALRTMGFRDPEVWRAMAKLESSLDVGAAPVETLLRQALLLLT